MSIQPRVPFNWLCTRVCLSSGCLSVCLYLWLSAWLSLHLTVSLFVCIACIFLYLFSVSKHSSFQGEYVTGLPGLCEVLLYPEAIFIRILWLTTTYVCNYVGLCIYTCIPIHISTLNLGPFVYETLWLLSFGGTNFRYKSNTFRTVFSELHVVTPLCCAQ